MNQLCKLNDTLLRIGISCWSMQSASGTACSGKPAGSKGDKQQRYTRETDNPRFWAKIMHQPATNTTFFGVIDKNEEARTRKTARLDHCIHAIHLLEHLLTDAVTGMLPAAISVKFAQLCKHNGYSCWHCHTGNAE